MRLTTTTLALALLTPITAFAQDPVPAAPPPPAAEPLPPPPTVEPITAPPPATAEMPPPVAPAPAPAPAAAPADAPIALKWEGLVDSYYMWNFTSKDSEHQQSPALRQFDIVPNSFSLNYAKLAVQADTDVVGFRVDFGYGHTGAIINAASGGSSNPMAAMALYSNAFIVQQAFATLKLGAVTIDAGKFNTTAGAEVIESNKNWLYSRSLLFFGIPLLHTGVRLNYKANDMVALQLTAANGWNNDPDVSGEKTFGANVALTFSPETSAYLTAYLGKEASGAKTRILVDAVVAQTVSETVSLNLNVDYLKEGDAYWIGGSLMGKFVVSDSFYLAARGEFIMGKKGGYLTPPDATKDSVSIYEGTLMAGLPFGKNYELRIEGRGDFCDQAAFNNGKEAKKNQFTALAAALAYF